MPGLTDCPDCPLRGSPTPCIVLATNHRNFCRRTDRGGPDYLPGMRERVVEMSGGPGAGAEPAVTTEEARRHFAVPAAATTTITLPEPQPTVTLPGPPAPSRREAIRRRQRLAVLARSCPYREQSCGCNPGKCWAGRGTNLLDPTRLYAGDCENCLAETLG